MPWSGIRRVFRGWLKRSNGSAKPTGIYQADLKEFFDAFPDPAAIDGLKRHFRNPGNFFAAIRRSRHREEWYTGRRKNGRRTDTALFGSMTVNFRKNRRRRRIWRRKWRRFG